jgi:serine/threonine protein kinase
VQARKVASVCAMSERGRTGRVVGGRFELLARLGSGGMGTVWRARDLGLHREVAIKEVRPADAALYENDPSLAAQQRERVLRESRALARLQHPNVVSIYQILESEDSPYPWIVMELVRGTSLDARLREGALTPVEAARIGRDVLGALRAAHAAGILHRDVKPGNVLLRPDGGAVLTDFGIAALHDSTTLTATGEVIGSPEYIAPERLHGDETQTSSDLWSLAMLLYVAVEGYHPMRRASTMATLAAVMTEPVPPPRRAGALGPALSAMLVPDPVTRPNGEQLDRMLAAAEHGSPAGVGPQLGPPTPAGPAFPAPPSGPQQAPNYQPQYQQFPAYQGPSGSHPYPAATPAPRKRVGLAATLFSLTAVVLVAALALLLARTLGSGDDPSTDAGSGSGSTGTQVATLPKVDVPATPPTTATTLAPPEDLLTPAGARKAVAALTEVMGGSKVSDLDLYSDHAAATAPAKTVKNGYDNFEYRNGTATRDGADTVDEDRAVLDLEDVNWDALPGLWKRAERDLGVDKPTLRYLVVDTGLIDHVPSLRLYLADDYGGAYLEANLAGKVTNLVPREG